MFALVPLIEDSITGAWSPFGWDSSWSNWIILGRNRDANDRLTTRALIWFDDDLVDGRVVKVADDPEEVMALTARTEFANFLGDRTISGGTRFHLAILDFLLSPPPGNRWGALGVAHDGYKRIWLGPGGWGGNLLWSEFIGRPRASITLSDDFNRTEDADGSDLSGGTGTWSEVEGSTWTLANNRAEANNIPSGTNVSCLVDTELDSDNAYAEIDGVVLNVPGSNRFAHHGVIVSSDASWANGYMLTAYDNNFNSTVGADFFRRDSGTDTSLGSDSGTDYTLTTLRITNDGGSLTYKSDGTTIIGPVTDTTHSGSGQRYVGFHARGSGASDCDSAVDDFLAADIVASVGNAGRLALLGVGA